MLSRNALDTLSDNEIIRYIHVLIRYSNVFMIIQAITIGNWKFSAMRQLLTCRGRLAFIQNDKTWNNAQIIVMQFYIEIIVDRNAIRKAIQRKKEIEFYKPSGMLEIYTLFNTIIRVYL